MCVDHAGLHHSHHVRTIQLQYAVHHGSIDDHAALDGNRPPRQPRAPPARHHSHAHPTSHPHDSSHLLSSNRRHDRIRPVQTPRAVIPKHRQVFHSIMHALPWQHFA